MGESPSASSRDHWIKCISTQGNIRGVAVNVTGIINTLAEAHQLNGVHVQALGEALMGAILIAAYTKPGERINLNIQGSGHTQQAFVDADPNGTVRGYVIGREAAFSGTPGAEDEGPWGTGLLSVLRTKAKEGEKPYIGTVPLLTGHLAKDLSFYWVQSEQVPSAVGLAVNTRDNRVVSAGAFLVQALPGANSDEIKLIEQHINEMHSLATWVSESEDPMHLLTQIFQSTAFMVIEDKPVRFECNCSRERVLRALALVGKVELQEMLDQDQSASVRCDFCTKDYKVEAPELQGLIEKVSG
jgi:molecular chaperone Hsp33